MHRPLFVAAILLLACPLLAADWPTYGHDIRRSGHTVEQLPAERLGEVWRYQSAHPPAPAWYGPAKWDAYSKIDNMRSMRNYDPCFHVISVGANVYFGSTNDDSVRCVDARTGKTKWLFVTGGPVRIAPTFVDGYVYFGSDDGFAYCVRAADGKQIWKTSASDRTQRVLHNGRVVSRWPVRSGVLVDGGTAYFAGSLLPWEASFLCAIDAKTGKIIGEGRYRKEVDGAVTFEGPLLASQAQLIAPQGRVAPLLFDRATGKTLGSVKGGGGSFVLLSPDKKILHGPGNKGPQIYTTDPANRKAKIASFEGGSSIVVDNQRTYLLSDSEIVAVDRKERRRLWATRCEHNLSMILAGDTLFAGGVDEIGAYDAATGERKWTSPVIGRAFGLVVSNGALYVSTDEGVVHCMRAGGKGVIAPAQFAKAPAAAPGAPEVRPTLKTQALRDPKLLGRWVFQRDAMRGRIAKNLAGAGGIDAPLSGSASIVRVGDREAAELDGKASNISLANALPAKQMPKGAMTIEAWVRVDRPAEWGGIVSAVRDDGDKEFGWLLGYRKDRFCFALRSAANKALTYLTADAAFTPGAWHHVAGVYDGKTMTLVVDGVAVATSEAQRGDIVYPDKTFYEIGSYRDSNERYRLTGAIHEVVLYDRAVTTKDLAGRYAKRQASFPAPIEIEPEAESFELAEGPWLTFTGIDRAEVRWRTAEPSPTKLVARYGDQRREFFDAKAKTEHAVTIDRLRRQRTYPYTIEVERDGQAEQTAEYECENFFNYNTRSLPDRANSLASEADREAAAAIIDDTGVNRGIVVVYGAARASLAIGLAQSSDVRVIVVDRDAAAVDALRRKLIAAGAYGARVEAHAIEADDALVYDAAFANMVIVPAGNDAAMVAAKRMAQPGRGVVVSLDANNAAAARWTRPTLPGAGSWTHQYGSADNSAFGGETLGGVAGTDAMRVQWIGRPGPRYQSDRQHRDPAPLAVGGRLFTQGWKRLIAMDQYNGTILWSLELPEVVRFNVTRDCANWCVDDKHVYLAAGSNAWVIDAATGKLLDRRPALAAKPNDPKQAWDWGYIGRAGDLLIGSSVKKDTAFTGMWGGEYWYDERKKGELTAVVASDALFAMRTADDKAAWRYDGALVLNPTITIADGRIYFVEVRSKADVDAATRRLYTDSMWKGMHLVALDLKTGERLWESKLDVPRGFSVVTAHGADRLAVVVSSNRGAFDVYGFEAGSGKPIWKADAPWENKGEKGEKAGHHGSHLQRPAIVGDKMYLRPGVFNIRTGERIASLLKPGHGCGTYAATAYSLIFRSESLSMWDASSNKMSGWSRLRPDCWLSSIPAGGMILSPEGGGGCSCGSWMETSLGFAPLLPGQRGSHSKQDGQKATRQK